MTTFKRHTHASASVGFLLQSQAKKNAMTQMKTGVQLGQKLNCNVKYVLGRPIGYVKAANEQKTAAFLEKNPIQSSV